MSESALEGGCLCGQVRWRATAAPANVRVCHCRLCQRATGGAFFARAIFRLEDFERSGETTSWSTSPRIDRHACGRCGTPMFAAPRDLPARIGVSIATCDDPGALRPDCHIWVSAKAQWLVIADGLPQFEASWSMD
ncbi:GFA family protein [Phenylobacterium sp.]|uniref:GFA family protein n=1 Tax=Phenylobacterium sp. TaxID=1871053 RepID=UPI0037C7CDC4